MTLDDLVKLHETAKINCGKPWPENETSAMRFVVEALRDEARAEVERLKERAWEIAKIAMKRGEDIREYKKEVARLREALTKIADYGHAIGCNPAGLAEIASAALEGK